MSDLVALRPGTILADDYRIERTLGAGGFGITYLAEEISLDRRVTIKEFFPIDFAARDHLEDVVPRSHECEGDYSWGLDRFLAEAQTLAKFNHPNIVRVYRYFLARNTGYIVLHFEEGQSLKSWLRGLGRAPRQPELDRIAEPLLAALETIHSADYLHRDIAPDNIMIRPDGAPVLIDFGSARGDMARHSKTVSALVKPGYSPYEQYATTSRQQGPWTDIYSLGATFYEAVTGKRPPDAPSRMVADELVPPRDAALSSYRPGFLAALAHALKLEVTERPRTISDWRAELLAPAGGRAEREAASPLHEARHEAQHLAMADADAALPYGAGGHASSVALKERPAPRQGLAGAFLEGWRKANMAAPGAFPRPAKVRPKPQPSPVEPTPAPATPTQASSPPVTKADAAAPAPTTSGSWSAKPRIVGLFARKAAPRLRTEPPGARRATPRALRKRSSGRWLAIAGKLALGVFAAAAAVAIQDKLPVARFEGSGVLTSQASIDVPVATLKSHHKAVTAVAWSPDGQHIASVSADGTLKVWSPSRSALERTLELDAGPASALAVANGRVATGHRDGSIAVWDTETGSRLANLKRNDAAILSLAFAGRPERLAAGSNNSTVTVWDVANAVQPLAVLDGHDGAVKALAYTARGPFIASASVDTTVRLWSIDKAEVVRSYRGSGAVLAAVTFDAQGRVLASGDVDGEIRLWSTYANRLKRRLKGHDGAISALAFMPDGAHLVSAGSDGTMRIWGAASGRTLRTLQAGNGAIAAICISPDGRRLAAAGADGAIRLFDATFGKEGT